MNVEACSNDFSKKNDVNLRFLNFASNDSQNDITHATVTITTEQLQNLYTSGPLEILPAPGDGFLYILHACSMSIYEGGTEFNPEFSYSNMPLVYANGDYPSLCYIPGSFFLDYSANRTAYSCGNIVDDFKPYMYTDEYANKAIAIYPSSVFTATGGSTRLNVNLWYSIISTTF